MSQSVLLDKSFDFAIRIINLSNYLKEEKKEYVLSKQILRSGTSIGANLHESREAQSRADFISKLSISLKEATETEYWLKLLVKTDYITQQQFDSLLCDCSELCKMLTTSIKTAKANTKN